jgi:uncharacterized protein
MTEQPLISVRAEAVRQVPPELAVFSVTVSARDKSREATLTRLAERAGVLRRVLDGAGDAIESRETGGVQVYPDVKRSGERVVAYSGSVTTTVTVHDFAELGDLLLRLANQDQTALSGPWWRLRPGSTAGAEVRREAIAGALSRAREYADAVGARVDRLVEISDEGAGGDGGGARPLAMASFRGTAPEVDLSLELDPQEQTVHAAVIVRVAITEPTALAPTAPAQDSP